MSYSLLSPYEDPVFNSGVARPFDGSALDELRREGPRFVYAGAVMHADIINNRDE